MCTSYLFSREKKKENNTEINNFHWNEVLKIEVLKFL